MSDSRVLIAWLAVGVIAFAIEAAVFRQELAGYYGAAARQRAEKLIRMYGGIRKTQAITFAGSLLFGPIALIAHMILIAHLFRSRRREAG